MPIKSHRDLLVWQLANELRKQILEFTATGPAVRDFKFCSQIRDAISSVCRNTSEGFYRFRHRQFAQFLDVARGSLGETQDALEDALTRKYVDQNRFDGMWVLSKRTMVALGRLHTYLRNTPDTPRTHRTRRT